MEQVIQNLYLAMSKKPERYNFEMILRNLDDFKSVMIEPTFKEFVSLSGEFLVKETLLTAFGVGPKGPTRKLELMGLVAMNLAA